MKTKEEISGIVTQLISRIREMPDGTRTTTAMLVREAGIKCEDWNDDLFEIHFALFSAAEAQNIYLDMTSHDNKVEGLPYNLDFAIYNDATIYLYCQVVVKGLDRPYSYICDYGYIDEGCYVEVPFGSRNKLRIGIVESCGAYIEENAPYPVRQTKHITRIATKEEYDAQGDLDPFRWDDDYDEDEIEEVNHFIACGDWDEVLEWAQDHHESTDPEVLKKVIECYELCIKQNMPVAALNLGTFYYTGRIVTQDYKKAFELYKIAADAGELRAICNCGYCFYYGRHQAPDYAEAFRYFSLGALLHNDANCLYKLGDLYLNGYGVDQNDEYAFMMYCRALQRAQESEADRPCIADTQFRVGKCLLRGIGIEKDIDEAHGLLSAALVNFYKRRKDDPFVAGLIEDTKKLIAEAQEQLDGETIGVGYTAPSDNDSDESELISPVALFSKYLELIFAKDKLWEGFQTYVRQSGPYRGDEFFEYHRDPECIETWRQMLDNMGGGFPLTLFASAAFLLLAYRDQGHDLDAELEALHVSQP